VDFEKKFIYLKRERTRHDSYFKQ